MIIENKEPWGARPPLTYDDIIKDSDKMDWEGEILVIKPEWLNESAQSIQNSLWKAKGGFGCRYTARGRAVLAECLADGETIYFSREEFYGIVKTGVLHEWLKDFPAPCETTNMSDQEAEQTEDMEVEQ